MQPELLSVLFLVKIIAAVGAGITCGVVPVQGAVGFIM
jgi:hypothetical protein